MRIAITATPAPSAPASIGENAQAELSDILVRLGPIADRLCTRAVVAQYEATRCGTSIADTKGPLPRFLPVRDVLQIIFNMDGIAAPDAVTMRLARSPRTTTEDALALTLPHAPTLRAALDLVARYGDAVVPWYWRAITPVGDELRIAYGPVVPMGRVEPLATEVALATIQRIVETFVGDRSAAARINFAAPTISSLPLLRERFGCLVTRGGTESFTAIPVEWGAVPSSCHDPQLWLEGVARCEADIAAVRDRCKGRKRRRDRTEHQPAVDSAWRCKRRDAVGKRSECATRPTGEQCKMKSIVIRLVHGCAAASLVLAPVAAAAKSASSLNDLVDARAAGAESDLESRGWTMITGHKGGSASYNYWWNRDRKNCVMVTTRDGRYASITDASAGDCNQKSSGGNATVELKTPDGGQRKIFFTGGRASGSDAEAGFNATRQGDLQIVRIGAVEVYRLPDALVVGG